MKPFDCAVIGAGPSGASAAYHLARRGHSVVLLEKELLPRKKPCGGGVSPQVQEWFDFNFGPAISCKARRVRCTFRCEDPLEYELSRAMLWMVRRETFDAYIVEQARAKGCRVRDGAEVLDFERCGGHWRIRTTKESVSARYLIAAEGAKSQSARALGFRPWRKVIGGAIEAEASVPEASDPVVHLEFGMVRGGYLWNFPKADGQSLGIGAFKGMGGKYLRETLFEYAHSFGVDPLAAEVIGYPVVVWSGRRRLHAPNALLAGEAAGVVDPLTAEGIRPAMRSGVLSADCVHRALDGDREALPRYSRLIHDELGVDMAWAARIAKLFYAFPRAAYEKGIKAPGALDLLAALVSGEVRYRDAAQEAIATLRSAITPFRDRARPRSGAGAGE